MASIRIVAVPPGFAPESIRQHWVGVVIQLATDEELKANPPSRVTIGNANAGGHVVLTLKAVEALRRAGQNDAADYWKYTGIGSYLVFNQNVCQIVD